MRIRLWPHLIKIVAGIVLTAQLWACGDSKNTIQKEVPPLSAATLLGNPDYPAISYGGYRATSREIQPTIEQLKNDLRILYALGYRLLRTYNLQFEHTPNLIRAIAQMKEEYPDFEMYLMLGTWMDCKNAWTAQPNHNQESKDNNRLEIERAIKLTNQYPDIIKIISVGNEAMVHWATSYYVQPNVILKWVNYLQKLKLEGKLPKDVWITSSDNFASWGGGDSSYHKEDLTQLIKAVDFLSVHTYPFHDSHYNPDFWLEEKSLDSLSIEKRVDAAMERALAHATAQYEAVKDYLASLNIQKPIHIGETGWASVSKGIYGANGSHAADEYKQALYYKKINQWSKENNVTTVYFSAFDEPWKDPSGPSATENNFGLFTVDGKAKYALWEDVERGVFDGLSREENGQEVIRSFDGEKEAVWATVLTPKTKAQ